MDLVKFLENNQRLYI
jgi:hypothetical protein